jgi:hypothetical protein
MSAVQVKNFYLQEAQLLKLIGRFTEVQTHSLENKLTLTVTLLTCIREMS